MAKILVTRVHYSPAPREGNRSCGDGARTRVTRDRGCATGDAHVAQDDVLPGRWAADPPAGTTLVLFGLRVNRWGRVASWLPLVRALRRMVAEAGARPDESGLLWARQWRDGRVFTVLSYWRDYETAMAWSQDARFIHRGIWRTYNRGRVGDSGDVGLWHEVIEIDPDRLHTIYRDVDRRGLAAATRYEDATEAHLRRARTTPGGTRDAAPGS